MFKSKINYKKFRKRTSYILIRDKTPYSKLEWKTPLVLSKKALDKLCLRLGSEKFKE